MDFNDTPEEAAFRAEARAFLADNAELKSRSRPVLRLGGMGPDAVRHCKEWQAKKADAGFAAITWPKQFGGREASPILQVIYQQEEENYAVPKGLFEIGLGMCIPTMMAYAKPEQLDRYVRPALRARKSGASFFPNQRADQIWRLCVPVPNATATIGSSTGRRFGHPVRISRISASSSLAATRPCRNMQA